MTSPRISDLTFNYASTLVNGVAGLVLPLLVGAWFGTSSFGVFTLNFSLYIILSQLAAFGIHLSVLKYLSENRENDPSILLGAVLAVVPLAVLTTAALLLLAKPLASFFNLPEMRAGIEAIGGAIFFFACNKVLLASLNAFMRLKEYAVYTSLRYLFLITSLSAIYAFGSQDIPLSIIFLLSEGALFAILLFALRNALLRGGDRASVFMWAGEHLRFGCKAFGGHILLDANSRVDILCLGYFVDSSTVGVYSMAAVLAEGTYQIAIVARTAYTPVVITLLYEKKYEDLLALVKRLRFLLWMGMAGIACVSIALYPVVLPFITGETVYADGVSWFVPLMVGVTIASGYAPVSLILAGGGFPGRQSLMVVMLFSANAMGNLVLIPALGPMGAAVGTAATYCLSVVLLRYYALRCLNLKL